MSNRSSVQGNATREFARGAQWDTSAKGSGQWSVFRLLPHSFFALLLGRCCSHFHGSSSPDFSLFFSPLFLSLRCRDIKLRLALRGQASGVTPCSLHAALIQPSLDMGEAAPPLLLTLEGKQTGPRQ